MKTKYELAAESVSCGHPDKMADLISDSILDHILQRDINARSAIETMLVKDEVIVGGEASISIDTPTIEKIVSHVINDIGYNYEPKISNKINAQSSELAAQIKLGYANDQCNVIGYATNATKSYLPLELEYAHKIMQIIHEIRHATNKPKILPDGKCQVIFHYEHNIPKYIKAVYISIQTQESSENLKALLTTKITKASQYEIKEICINPGGAFTIGGAFADTGMTGRKNIIDTYGPYIPHGGGCFSGKDYTKLDRSGAYFARWIAKNIVHKNICDTCTVFLSYMFGNQEPSSITIKYNGDNIMDNKILKRLPLNTESIIKLLRLKHIKYTNYTNYGHFCNKDAPWEKLNKEFF